MSTVSATLPLSKNISNQELADIFSFISGALEIKKADFYRVRAYDNVAASLQTLDKPWHQLVDEGYNIEEIPGVGESIAAKLKELRSTGTIKAFEKYAAGIPGGVYPLTKIHGIGAKKAFKLAHHFHLDNPDTAISTLLKLAESGQVRSLPSFGEKSEEVLIDQLQRHLNPTRMTFAVANAKAKKLIAEIKTCPTITKIEALGSLRRQSPTVGDIDLGICVTNIDQARECLAKLPSVREVIVSGEGLIRLLLKSSDQVDVKVSTPAEWGAFIQHFTGSKNHNILLRQYALSKGLSLSEHGIKNVKSGEIKKFADEKEFYAYLGLKYIEPADRAGNSEIEAAKQPEH